MRKLGISMISDLQPEIDGRTRLRMIKEAGFDCFFPLYYDQEPIEAWAEDAAAIGLSLETVHPSFEHMNDMWLPGVAGDDYLSFLKTRINGCVRVGATICIMHVTIASQAPPVSRTGLERFHRLADYAAERGVRLAFENLEIPEHLHAVLGDNPAFHGFCWDCGHNYSYTPTVDMMSIHGKRMLCMHVHDNFGMRTPGFVTYHDDLHMLPFDGGLNWQGFAERIKASGFTGPLTLELHAKGRPEYPQMGLERYLAEAYQRAVRLRAMCDSDGE